MADKTPADIVIALQDNDVTRESLLKILQAQGGHETLKRIVGLAETLGGDDGEDEKDKTQTVSEGLELLKGNDDIGCPTLTLNTVSPEAMDRTRKLGDAFGSFRRSKPRLRSTFSAKGSSFNFSPVGSPTDLPRSMSIAGGKRAKNFQKFNKLRVDHLPLADLPSVTTPCSQSTSESPLISPKLELPSCETPSHRTEDDETLAELRRGQMRQENTVETQTDTCTQLSTHSMGHLDQETLGLLRKVGFLKDGILLEKQQLEELKKKLSKRHLKQQHLSLQQELRTLKETNDKLRVSLSEKSVERVAVELSRS